MNKNRIIGAVLVVFAFILAAYTYVHRPVSSLLDAAQRMDVSWVFKQEMYYAFLFFAVLIAICGVLRLVKGKE